MNTTEKKVSYRTANSYSTLNTLSHSTKNIWIVFHGIGYLSRFFLRFFNELPEEENYIIAPQAPSKYYLHGAYTHVGASWLTRENTMPEAENIYAYLDALWEIERLPQDRNILVFGFSQGVSIATRWVAKRQLRCAQLILYAGGIPKELTPADLAFLETNGTQVSVIVGDQDEYLTEERRKEAATTIQILFAHRAKEIIFKGGHEVKKEIINALV